MSYFTSSFIVKDVGFYRQYVLSYPLIIDGRLQTYPLCYKPKFRKKSVGFHHKWIRRLRFWLLCMFYAVYKPLMALYCALELLWVVILCED